MTYQVSIKFEIVSGDYADPPTSVHEVERMIYEMMRGGVDWPSDVEFDIFPV